MPSREPTRLTIVILVVHLFVAAALVGLVLLQRSEGGALGMGGGSNSLISGRGAADALARMTMAAGAIFFVTSITLTMLAGSARRDRSVIDQIPVSEPSAVPAPALPQPSAALPSDAPSEAAAAGESQVVPSALQAVQRAGPLQPRAESPAAVPGSAGPAASTPAIARTQPAASTGAVLPAQSTPTQSAPARLEAAPRRAAAAPPVSTVIATPAAPPAETIEAAPIAAPAPTIPRPRAGPEE